MPMLAPFFAHLILASQIICNLAAIVFMSLSSFVSTNSHDVNCFEGVIEGPKLKAV